jgi:hypothetical protein
MLPIANLNIKDLYQSTFEFFASRTPSFSFSAFSAEDSFSDISFPLTPRDPTPKNLSPDEESVSLRDRLDAAELTDSHNPSSCNLSCGASAAASTLYSMRREHDVTKNELSKTQAEVARWEEKYKTLEKTLKETRDLLKIRDKEIQVLKERERHTPERHRPSTSIDRRRSHDLAHQRSDSSQSQQIRLSADWSEVHDDTVLQANGNHRRSGSDPYLDNMSTVSEEERAQSRGLETFLNKIDLWSGAQVIQAVQDLNSEILQFAASATELCTFSKQRPNSAKVTQASSEVATRLGAALSRLLATRDHSQDPMLVQLALQGCISYCISRALSSFCIGYQSKANITLTQIYTHMFHSGKFLKHSAARN